MPKPFIAAENAIGIHLTFLGLGQHVSDVQPSIVSTFLKLLYINYPIYDFAVTLPKISALLFYARVFSARTNASLRYVLWITGALSVLWLVAAVFIAGFQCTPTYKAWDTAVSGTCIGTFQWWLPTATISATIDLIILLIPMPLLWKLRLRPLKKFGLLWVFALGYSVIVVQIGRLIVLSKIGVKLDEDVTCKSGFQTLRSVGLVYISNTRYVQFRSFKSDIGFILRLRFQLLASVFLLPSP